MAKKPLFYEGMTNGERLRSVIWVIVILVALGVFLFGAFFLPRSSGNDTKQDPGESDYEYHQRIQGQDEEQYKDCGFKPTC